MEQADVVICGGGLAGLTCAFDLLNRKKTVLVLDRDGPERLGGLARKSFGGVMMAGTPLQQRSGIPDSPELAYADWLSYAEFVPDATLEKAWARAYCEQSVPRIYEWLTAKGVSFLPVVNWPERGLFVPGNSVPRWHITWGTGHELVARLLAALEAHPERKRLTFKFHHRVESIDLQNGAAAGVRGVQETTGTPFYEKAGQIVLAAGGVCGGDLSLLKRLWNADLGPLPHMLLNGSHRFADGRVHEAARQAGARISHLDQHWHYAAGIPHPKPEKENDGLSLVPPRSALWITPSGRRHRPAPLVSYTDTRHLVQQVARNGGYAWLVMNRRIAEKELAVSGSDFMTAFREKNRLRMVKELVLGNRALVDRLLAESGEFVTARSLDDLAGGMQALAGDPAFDRNAFVSEVRMYDARIRAGRAFHNEHQLRWIAHFRQYRGDRLRVCDFQPVEDPKAGELIAVRTFILTRKSLGGVCTDLQSRVLDTRGEPIPGLFAAGETAGFGGGGIHGKRSLEGTFLGGCILTARAAAAAIA